MNKLLNMLGLARRAGKIQMGFDAAVEAIKNGTAKGIVVACDISEKTIKNINYEAQKIDIEVIRIEETSHSLSVATGKRAGIAAICDQGFFEAIKALVVTDDTERKDGILR